MRDRGWIRAFVTSLALLAVLGGCAHAPPAPAAASAAPALARAPKSVIIMFADGAAPTQWEFGRYSSQVLRKQPFVTTDVVFREGALGLLITTPHGAFVTDSAAAASA